MKDTSKNGSTSSDATREVINISELFKPTNIATTPTTVQSTPGSPPVAPKQ